MQHPWTYICMYIIIRERGVKIEAKIATDCIIIVTQTPPVSRLNHRLTQPENGNSEPTTHFSGLFLLSCSLFYFNPLTAMMPLENDQ